MDSINAAIGRADRIDRSRDTRLIGQIDLERFRFKSLRQEPAPQLGQIVGISRQQSDTISLLRIMASDAETEAWASAEHGDHFFHRISLSVTDRNVVYGMLEEAHKTCLFLHVVTAK
jgi:hypothetical protein